MTDDQDARHAIRIVFKGGGAIGFSGSPANIATLAAELAASMTQRRVSTIKMTEGHAAFQVDEVAGFTVAVDEASPLDRMTAAVQHLTHEHD